MKTYYNIEPRISGRVMLGKHTVEGLHYELPIHALGLASVTLPTDFWMPSTGLLKPQEGHQWALGYFHNFFHDQLETSVEGYYKLMGNLIEYKDGQVWR